MEGRRILPGMCRRMGLEMDNVCRKTKQLLIARQEMAWIAPDYSDSSDDGYIYYSQPEKIQEALDWIKEYYCSDASKNEHEDEYLMVLWQSGLMNKLFAESAEKLASFQKVGNTYYTLIKKHYLDEKVLSQKELEEMLGISRSTYYARLQEAFVALGLAFYIVSRSYTLEDA